jgi:hypothetical protein
LGLRFNLLIRDDKTAKPHEADPNATFKAGNCFQIRLRPNRTGRIYAFNQGTSGNWNPLLPSPEAAGEKLEIQAGVDVTVPAQSCFAMNGTQGVDKLFIALADKDESPSSIDQDLIKGGPLSKDSMMAMAKTAIMIPNTPDKAALVSRDLSIQRIVAPMEAAEPPNSVYVVKTVAAKTERMVIEIPIRHE